MRRLSIAAPVALCLALAVGLLSEPAAAQKRTKEDGAAAEEKLTGRLPNYYGMVGVSDEQRQTIYRIQADYDLQVDALLEELEELRDERDAKVAEVLTEDQVKKVQELRAAARAKRAARKKKD